MGFNEVTSVLENRFAKIFHIAYFFASKRLLSGFQQDFIYFSCTDVGRTKLLLPRSLMKFYTCVDFYFQE